MTPAELDALEADRQNAALIAAARSGLDVERLREALDRAGDAGPDGCVYAPLLDTDTMRTDDLHHGADFAADIAREYAALQPSTEGNEP